jgi:sugar O-acyltransferase (sialic acid O-acetyltransferase NeuD family)
MSHEVAVYGCGGFGRGIAWLAQVCGAQVVCFIDDRSPEGTFVNGIQVASLPEARRKFPDARVAVAVNDPRTRETLALRAEGVGFSLATLLHPRVELSPWVQVGQGSIVREGCCFSVNVELGRNVLLNMDCTIGHDVVVGDFASLAPGSHVSGFVHLGRRAHVGTGAVILQGQQGAPLVIGDDAMIGAGACVTKSVLPARPIGWTRRGDTETRRRAVAVTRRRGVALTRRSGDALIQGGGLEMGRRPVREESSERNHVS